MVIITRHSLCSFSVMLLLLLNNCFAQSGIYKISGTVYNKAEGPNAVLENASVELLVSDSVHYETKTDSIGHYTLEHLKLLPNKIYSLACTYIGYLTYYEKINVEENNLFDEFKVDFNTHLIICKWHMGLSEHLPKRMFSKSSYKPTNALKKGLKKEAGELDENPTLTILISGHIDYDETIQGDTMLAYNRALAVKKILIGYGIEEKRLAVRSLGITKPYTMSEDTLELKKGMVLNYELIQSLHSQKNVDLGHQLNRRISFEIVRTDYVPYE
ncbi:MAG: OmpA family protein [Bacteroidia bacterium]